MKKGILSAISLMLVLFSCGPDKSKTEVHELDLTNKIASEQMLNSTVNFTTYLPVYSSVHTLSEKEIRSLTSTVSIHNMNLDDSLIVKKIDYFNTEGEFVRSYVDEPIFLKPMETINIVVHQTDNDGGTGANFMITWSIKNLKANYPLIEAVMISTAGQQGISFTSRGVLLDTPSPNKLLPTIEKDSL